MVYLCERCGSIAPSGRVELIRIDEPVPGVLTEEQSKKPVELCEACANFYQKNLIQAELLVCDLMFPNLAPQKTEETRETEKKEGEGKCAAKNVAELVRKNLSSRTSW